MRFRWSNVWAKLLITLPFPAGHNSQFQQKRARRYQSGTAAVEQLEDRSLLSPFYDLTTVASTAGGVFSGFGDLISVNNAGDIAFVGRTDTDEGEASGLWVAPKVGGLENINPLFSDNPSRDFGRAAEINNNGIVLARDQVFGFPGSFFIRAWLPGALNDDEIRASANNLLQPDFGRYSALQTFADINDNGDIAFVALSADGKSRLLMFQPAAAGEAIPVYSFPVNESVARPQLTKGGRILERLGSNTLVVVNPYSNQFDVVANGFSEMGFAPGMSDNGDVVAFVGNRGNGPGVFVAWKTDAGYQYIPIAGEGQNGWNNDSFDLLDSVRVNNTLDTEHGVTVAFEGDHPVVGHGIYTVRVSFFGDSIGADFTSSQPTSAIASAAIPVITNKDSVHGSMVKDVELWNGVDDVHRGEVVFWAKLANEQEEVLRATATSVIWVDFNPVSSGNDIGVTFQNQKLLESVGVTNAGWSADFDQSLITAGYSANTNFGQLRTQIVNQVQQYFDATGVTVTVLGKPGDVQPAFVPYSTTEPNVEGGVSVVDHGAFMTIQVGGTPQGSTTELFGQASGPIVGPNGALTLDFFNQTQDDLAVVFADNILKKIGTSSSLTSVTTAIARTIAHEAGHNLGLVHLNTSNNLDLMNARIESSGELTATSQLFRDGAILIDGASGTSENSKRRIWFALGSSSAGHAPSAAILSSRSQASLMSLGGTITTPIMVQRVLVGLIHDDDTLPTYIDLGGGNLTDVLARSRISVQSGDKYVVLGSTNGTTLDIVGVVPGQEAALTGLNISQLGLSTEERLRATVGSAPALNMFQLTPGGPVELGSTAVQGVPVLELAIAGSPIAAGEALGLGETTPGGGSLAKTLTIQNTGSGVLNLGTVSVTGSGYSVTQPALATLSPGQSTTFTITLSDTIAGIGLQGQLLIPSNDPTGDLSLTLRGTVDSRPRILGITRLDNGTGPLSIAIDFSGQLKAAPAGEADNFTITASNGDIVPVASAVYSQTGLLSRVTLTASVNAESLQTGEYQVRIDGTKVVATNGAPLATTRENLLTHQVWEKFEIVTIGGDGSGSATVLIGPELTGLTPPKFIVQEDLNGDGIQDYVATGNLTGELVFHFGQPEGGYEITRYPLAGPTPDLKAAPQSILVADWNSDGIPDLIVADRVNDYYQGAFNRIFVLVNDGKGNFSNAIDTPIPIESDAVGILLGVADFTGDGQLDIAVAGRTSRVNPFLPTYAFIAIYGKDPFIGYSKIDEIPVEHPNAIPTSGMMADLNGDNRPDLVVETSDYPVIFLNSPTGLILGEDVSYNGEPGSVAVADFNGDGDTDIAVVNDNYSNAAGIHEGGVISLLLGNGSGQFVAQPNIILNRRGVTFAAVGDFDQDGKTDLILKADPFAQVGYDTTSEISIWPLLGDGFGDFDLSAPLIPLKHTGNVAPSNFILKDLTGDGFPELSFGNLATGRIGLFANDGAGHLTPSMASPLTSTITGARDQYEQENLIIIADFNRDGFPDQARAVSEVGIFQLQAIDIFWGNQSGDFEIVNSVNVPSNEQSLHGQYVGDIGFIRAGDVNNDGWLDLIVGADNGNGGPLMVLSGIDGRNFEYKANLLVDAGAGVGVLTGNLVDINGDGNLDFVAVTNSSGTGITGFGTFFGNGTGLLTYNQNSFQTVPGMAFQIPVIADFNGDNKLDVAVGSYAFNGSDNVSSILIYQGLGNGRFTVGQTIMRPIGDSEPHLFLADINGDGRPDLLSPNEEDRTLDFYLATNLGQFAPAPELTISIPYAAAHLVVGDFTGDGFDDIAISQDTTSISDFVSTVPIFPGDGTGHFSEPQLIETGALWPFNFSVIPIAGSIGAGAFTITRPVLSVPAGVLNITASTKFQQSVAINPRPLLSNFSNDPLALAVTVAPLHGSVTIQSNGTFDNLSDDTFSYTPATGFSGIDQFTYFATDGRGGSATGVVSITVSPANQNPVLTLTPGPLNYFELYGTRAIDPGAMLTDSDTTSFQGAKLRIQITEGFDPEFDYLELESTGSGPGELVWFNDGTLSYSGVEIGNVMGGFREPFVITFTSPTVTRAIVEDILRQIKYGNGSFERPVASQRTVKFIVTDGEGGASTATRTILLPLEGSNLKPVVTTSPGSPVYSIGSPAIIIDDAVTVTDADSPNFENGTLTVDYPDVSYFDDRLAIQTQGTGTGQINLSGSSIRYGSITFATYFGGFTDYSDLEITFNSIATPVMVQALMRQITFRNVDGFNPVLDDRQIRFVVTDGAGGVSDPAIRTITFNVPQSPPEISVSQETTEYTAGEQPVTIDPDIFVDDSDSDDFNGGSLMVDFVSGQSNADRLAIRNEGTLLGQINLSGNSVKFGSIPLGTFSGGFTSNSPLVISFNSNASPARVELFMRQLTFNVDSSNPTTTDRVIRFVLNDGDGGVSAPATKTVTVGSGGTGSNEAPTIQLPSAAKTFSKLGPAVAVDSQAIVLAPGVGTGTIGGGVLTISINDVNTGKKKLDLFNISSLNVVGTLRGTQLINGRLVSVFDLDANISASTVQNALRAVTFQTSKKGLKFTTRTVQIRIEDSEGDASAVVTKTINVSKKKFKLPN